MNWYFHNISIVLAYLKAWPCLFFKGGGGGGGSHLLQIKGKILQGSHRLHSVFTDFQGLEKLIPFFPNFQRLCEPCNIFPFICEKWDPPPPIKQTNMVKPLDVLKQYFCCGNINITTTTSLKIETVPCLQDKLLLHLVSPLKGIPSEEAGWPENIEMV